MAKNNKFLIVKDDIINCDDNELLLPVVLHIQSQKGLTEQCSTSLKMILNRCGYDYRRTGYCQNLITKIREALHFLQTIDCIESFTDGCSDTSQDISAIAPGTLINIKVNPDMLSDTANGFLKIPLQDYVVLIEESRKDATVRLCKIIKLYCYISRRLFQTAQPYTAEQAKDEPIYFRVTLEKIYEELGKGFHPSATSTMIEFLNKHNLLHSEVPKAIKAQDGSVRQVGIVFVRHSSYWEEELRIAIEKARQNRRAYYNYILDLIDKGDFVA